MYWFVKNFNRNWWKIWIRADAYIVVLCTILKCLILCWERISFHRQWFVKNVGNLFAILGILWLCSTLGNSVAKFAEMSGLWNFSVRVQSWSDKIESDPVLIRKIFENHLSDPVLSDFVKMTLTRVSSYWLWLKASHHFFQSDSSPSHLKSWLESRCHWR